MEWNELLKRHDIDKYDKTIRILWTQMTKSTKKDNRERALTQMIRLCLFLQMAGLLLYLVKLRKTTKKLATNNKRNMDVLCKAL